MIDFFYNHYEVLHLMECFMRASLVPIPMDCHGALEDCSLRNAFYLVRSSVKPSDFLARICTKVLYFSFFAPFTSAQIIRASSTCAEFNVTAEILAFFHRYFFYIFPVI